MEPAWQKLGFTVTSVNSIQEAIYQFRYGDFDLVILGDDLSAEKKERLMFLLRASGSKVPVVSPEDGFGACGPGMDGNQGSDLNLAGLKQLVSEQAGRKAI
jgi:hypothetical protein